MTDENKLVVRVYNVGFGDSIYIGVPDVYEEDGVTHGERRHIFIDCGSTKKPSRQQGYETKEDMLKRALENMRGMLPEVDGKKHLDLLVVTHPHQDHYDGFDPEYNYFDPFFNTISIGHVWLSALLDENNPDHPKINAVEELAYRGIQSLKQRGLPLGERAQRVLQAVGGELKRVHNALRGPLSASSKAQVPLYAFRDIADPSKDYLSKGQRAKHAVAFDSSTETTFFSAFKEEGTRLYILGPEWTIDETYLGQQGDEIMMLLQSIKSPAGAYQMNAHAIPVTGDNRLTADDGPQFDLNVSLSDFQTLRRRLYCTALRYGLDDSELKNNTSVVLLLEWRGKRLLFTGDVQQTGWNAMKTSQHLATHVDFLKVGHHGSHNATPFLPGATTQPEILDTLLPTGRVNEAISVVSVTPHGSYDHIPMEELMLELGQRAHVRRTDQCDTPLPEHDTAYSLKHTDDYVEVTFT